MNIRQVHAHAKGLGGTEQVERLVACEHAVLQGRTAALHARDRVVKPQGIALFDVRGDKLRVAFLVAGKDMLTGAGAHLGVEKADVVPQF